jgi:hypothetical protein
MSKDQSGYKHNASDKALDAAAQSDNAPAGADPDGRAGHRGDETGKQHDKGNDRMFEGREQHDDADMRSEKNRLAKDETRHDHATEAEEAVTKSNMHVKRKD